MKLSVLSWKAGLHFSILLLFLSLWRPVLAQSSHEAGSQTCSPELIDAIGKSVHMGGPGGRNPDEPVADACKVWPKDNAITLAAIAYPAGSVDEIKLVVAMLDNTRNLVIASYNGVFRMHADMRVGHANLKIDTARYDVRQGMRALGVDISDGQVAGCGERRLVRTRNLYVLDGDEIRPIVEGFHLAYQRVVRGDRGCAATGGDGPLIETTTLKIAIDKSVTNGFSDLSIFSVSSYNDGTESERAPFRYELKYDGTRYPLHEMNRAYLEWLR